MPTQVRHHQHVLNTTHEQMSVCGLPVACLHCSMTCSMNPLVPLLLQAAPLPTASWSWRWSSGTAASSGACQRWAPW